MAQLPMVDQSLLIVFALLLTVLLIASMGYAAWIFDLRKARLPEATLYEDLRQRNDALAGQVADRQAMLEDINRQIQERDRIGAEVAVLIGQRDDLRLELSGLEEGRMQVEEVKRKAAEAATEYAEARDKMEAARRELAEAEAQRAQLRAAQDDIARLRAEAESLRTARAALDTDLVQLREELARLQVAVGEARTLAGQIDALGHEIVRLQQRKEDAAAAAGEAVRRRDEMLREIDAMQPDVAKSRDLSACLPELEARKAALEQRIRELEEQPKEPVRPEVAPTPPEDPLQDLRHVPACLTGLRGPDRADETETQAVEDVCSRLEKAGLRYHRRVVRAFHTALKINDAAQVTVLAGVSGTGKSLLPRLYAEAIGMGFLQIAVEPRWDSPQDLLGFYNYVEKRYRATDLARALVHMDPYDTSGLAEQPSLGDRMLLVLLDEMNLARVEYYFSEFLSRLEVRPPFKVAADATKRRDAAMPIDIRDGTQQSISLFPSHNVLFAGTMNDDESTQSLSDKVLDRANVMQFAAPNSFAAGTRPLPQVPAGMRRFSTWRNWIKPLSVLQAGHRAKADDVVGKLARVMQEFGRPFGHRMNEAIRTYVANYPPETADSIDEPLVDQIEFRILPKLRGVQIGDHRSGFDDLVRLVRDDLHDAAFASCLEDLVNRQEGTTGQFNWRGFDRDAG